jgi:alpha-1,4-digalacturonate transport system permease protein
MRVPGYSVTGLQRHGYVFIAPTLILFSVFLIYPMLSAFDISLFDWNLISPRRFVGLKNFRLMLQDPMVANSYGRTISFCALTVAATNVLAFSLALMLQSNLARLKNFLQSLIFLPVVLSLVAVGVVWELMFQSTGLISTAVRSVFGASPAWLTDTRAAPYSMVIIATWKSAGFYMIMYIAGLLDIPETYYEAARIDGAGFWRQLASITLPSLKNTFVLTIVSSIIFSFGQFAIQYVITKGGPSHSTEILALLIYRQGFELYKFGYSSALSILFFMTLLVFSLIQLKLMKAGE